MDAQCLGIADKKKAARCWMINHFGARCGHVWRDNSVYLTGDAAHCDRCDDSCSMSQCRPDVSSGGLPCQSVSRMRDKTKTGNRGPMAQHDSIATVMVQYPAYLDRRNLRSWWIEESSGFGSERSAVTGRTALQIFCESCAKAGDEGYAVRALFVDHIHWVKVPRLRIIVLGFSPEAGGAAAADWAVREIEECVRFRKSHGPCTSVEAIVSSDDPVELKRRPHIEETHEIALTSPPP